MAARKIKLAHPGKILRQEFMEPVGLSAYADKTKSIGCFRPLCVAHSTPVHGFVAPRRSPGAEVLRRYLAERGYAPGTLTGYVGSAAHFLHWTEHSGLAAAQLDEAVVASFLDQHLPRCDCGGGQSSGH